MENTTEIIKYTIIILMFVLVGYFMYLIYKDIVDIKKDNVNLRNSLSEIQIKMLEDKKCDVDNDNGSCDTNSDDDSDLEDFEINQHINNDIFDQLTLNSSQLDRLSKIQSEIEGNGGGNSVIEELLEDSISESDIDIDVEGGDGDSKSQCTSILKSGKNKGLACGKVTTENSLYCKLHQPSV